MFDFGANTYFELFCLFSQRTPRRMLLLLALTKAHGNVPVHARGLIALGCTLIARVSEDNSLLPIQQRAPLSHIVYVGRCTDDVVYQAEVSVYTDVAPHCEVPFVGLLGLVHLRVPLAVFVLGGTRCRDQCGIGHRADPEHETLGGEFVVDELQDARAQAVIFKQMFEAHSAHPVWDSLGTAQAHEVTMVSFQSMTIS